MKKTKRILAIVLTVIMLMATMATTAFAVETPITTTGSVKITNAMAGTTYSFYRVFDISKVETFGNFFITNNKWDAKTRTDLTGYVTVTGTGVGSAVTPVTTFNTPAQAQLLADVVKGAGIAADKETTPSSSGAVTIDDLQYGYYVMVSSRPGATKWTTFTLNSGTVLDIREKNDGYPQLEKTVNSKTGVSAETGADLFYVITLKAAAGTETYTITDTTPAGISVKTSTIAVEKNGVALTADKYTLSTTGDPTVITVTLSDTVRNSLVDGEEITISYTASLNANATSPGANTNRAEITCLKDGVDQTLTAEANVFTGQLEFDKLITNTADHLAGAGFKVKKGGQYALLIPGGANTYVIAGWDVTGTEITTADATITIKGLDEGAYTLEETTTPANYFTVDAIPFEITTTKDGDGNVTAITNPALQTVYNTPGTELPETGGIGTTIFYITGTVLVLGAVVLLALKKRQAMQA